jgi:hypothetical protein
VYPAKQVLSSFFVLKCIGHTPDFLDQDCNMTKKLQPAVVRIFCFQKSHSVVKLEQYFSIEFSNFSRFFDSFAEIVKLLARVEHPNSTIPVNRIVCIYLALNFGYMACLWLCVAATFGRTETRPAVITVPILEGTEA